jgi:hypothetical protein
VPITLDPASADEYWDFITEIAAPVVAGLAQADDAARARIRTATIEQVRSFEADGRPRVPGLARCITGTK